MTDELKRLERENEILREGLREIQGLYAAGLVRKIADDTLRNAEVARYDPAR